ncbi:hypothetical protein MN116_003120 [Schistosoma mekongi]|uniref:Protein MAK10 homolog n=1 Tax=Schistosoma mekongi TaxID=38744 RepID=A0AAE1ZIA7_SCHME|nr:hypothetical protein MN116_003120 [Schistosoma mekongi]
MHTELSEEVADSVHPDLTSVCKPIDITNAFFSACRIGLEPGELLHDNQFSLQYSMSAIEIMDPKVDARTQGNRKVVTVSEALSAGQLPLGPFSSLYELLGIMDELLSSYVNWLTGDSLAQSVFICMYMHCTQLVRDKYLVAFCELLRRSIYQLRHIIITVGVFDEEDHYTFTHGMPIHGPSNIFNGYNDFRSICLHKFPTFGLVAHVNDLIKNLEHDSTVFTDCDDKLLMGLRSRLEFIQVLLSFTNSIFERIGPDCNFTEELFEGHTGADINFVEKKSPKLYEVQDDTQVLWVAFIDFCRNVSQHTTRLELLSSTLVETSNIGKVAGDGRLKPKDTAYGLPGFEVFLNQTNIPSLMLTVVNIHGRHKSFVYFSNLFKRLNHILCTYENFALWHNAHPDPLLLHSLWAFIQKCGQVSCSYVKALSFSDDSSELKEPTLSTCVLSRTITYVLYFALMCQGNVIDCDPSSISPMHFHCFVNAWHQLECVAYRPLIKNIISSIPELTDFFTTLSTHFAHIPAIYCFNRSRQRSALGPWLQHLPDFLDECARAEFVIGVELRNKLANVTTANCFESLGKFEDLITQKSVVPVQINLSHFITYVYYYLAWDYIASGFQLELYSSNEWLFIYAFMIHLFQNLGALIRSLSENYMVLASGRSVTVESEPIDNKGLNRPNSKCDSVNDVKRLDSRQCKKKKKHRGKCDISSVNSSITEMPNTMDLNGVSEPISPMIHEIGSTFEVHSLSIHQYLNTASLYAIRALQRDSGIEINENGGSSNFTFGGKLSTFINRNIRLESYARRLGIFLIPHNSPLVEMGGVSGAYKTWTSLVGSSIIDGHPTSDLYLMASKAFDQAQNMIQKTLCLQSLGEEQLLTFMQSHIYISLFTERLGPPDRLTDLQQLARRNSIACRVLGVCEDRRPIVHTSDPSTINPKMSFLCSSSPVKLDYTFLESKCYPLIRLTNQSEKC